MDTINNYNQLNQTLNRIDISKTLINYNAFINNSTPQINRYDEFKHGLGNDISKIFKSLTDSVIFFILLVVIGILYFLVFSNYFHHTPEFKVLCGIPLVLVTMGLLFSKSIGNTIISFWFFIFKLAVNLLIIGVFGGIIYVIFNHLFLS